MAGMVILLASVLLFAADPAPPPQDQPPQQADCCRHEARDHDLLYKVTLAPDAFLTYVQLTSPQRARYKFYAKHMSETQRLEYLRRVRADDRENYARQIGLPVLPPDLIGEPPAYQPGPPRLDLGMSKDQVRSSMGEPSGKNLGAGELYGRKYDRWERWTWGSTQAWFVDGKVVAFE